MRNQIKVTSATIGSTSFNWILCTSHCFSDVIFVANRSTLAITNSMGDLCLLARSNFALSVDGLSLDDVKPDTVAVASRHENQNDLLPSRPIVPPVYNASTYELANVKDYLEIYKGGGHLYSRLGNANSDSVECVIADLEGGAGSLVFASGMAAISTCLLTFLRSGDHIVCTNPVYAGTLSLIQHTLSRFNISVTYAESGAPVETWRGLIKPNTKVLYGETPCNPDMSILDLEDFGKLGQDTGILTFVDSTFASPYLQQPIKHGVDISIHSATKYLGGHSDLVAGVLTTSTSDLWRQVKHKQMELGTVLCPQSSSLLLRGLKTLPLRMIRHSSNAMRMARYLENHPKVARVAYPGLKSHPQHEVAARQMKDYSGMVMLDMKGGIEAASTLVESVRVIRLAVSLGGVESLMEHAASMTHGPMFMSDEDRLHGKITDGMVRFSVGLEDPDDLLADLEQALNKVPA